MSDDNLLFMEEDPEEKEHQFSQITWKVLIVDDEKSIHDVTRLALKRVTYKKRKIEFLHAYSAEECKEIIKEHSDIALILLDVVMESDSAGLDAVDYIRNTLRNKYVRIILRTGQPGQAPEQDIILNYDINDYKEKTELTSKKLYSCVISALRSYQDIVRIEKSRQGLESIISATSGVFKENDLETLFNGILTQILSLVGLTDDDYNKTTSSLMAVFQSDEDKNLVTTTVFTGTGRFSSSAGKLITEVVDDRIYKEMNASILANSNIYSTDNCVIYLKNSSLVYIETLKELDVLERNLLDVFCSNVGIAYENSYLNSELVGTQKEIIMTLGATAEFRSQETGEHVIRVAELSKRLAELAGLSQETAEILKLASPMHDIGKIAIPDNILLKKGKLTDDEFELMKTHTSIGYDIFKESKRPILQAAATIAHEHQEKWDGTGYPLGLQGDKIHIFGRITAIADVFDALASKRCYKKAWDIDTIKTFFVSQRGLHFEPLLIDIFLQHFDEFIEIRSRFEDK